ncbi:MAG: hypothetical protein FJ147_28030 [Deltaproteobacteria bacterium]|nr:hypothetical protein [Deltaproteobacteria bacterium]
MYRLVAIVLSLLLPPTCAWAASSSHLVVADAPAEKLYVYRLPDLELTGEFSEIRLADEVGFVSLNGERVLFVNESGSGHSHDHDEEAEASEEEGEEAEGSELIVLKLNLQGQPAIIARAPIIPKRLSH